MLEQKEKIWEAIARDDMLDRYEPAAVNMPDAIADPASAAAEQPPASTLRRGAGVLPNRKTTTTAATAATSGPPEEPALEHKQDNDFDRFDTPAELQNMLPDDAPAA